MKRRRLMLTGAGVLVAVFVAILVWPRKREPEYQGRTLSFWLALSSNLSVGDGTGIALEQRRTKAADAVLHIGTNGVPWLLNWIRYDPAPWQRKLHASIRKMPVWLGKGFGLHSLFADKSQAAITGFWIMGPQAKPAIPELVRLLGQSGATNYSSGVLMALAAMGEGAVPPLVTVLTNQSAPNRHLAAAALGYVKGGAPSYGTGNRSTGADISSLAPLLVRCLADTDGRVAEQAARLLGSMAVEPGIVVSALIESLCDLRSGVRREAVQALGNFGEHARPAVPALVRCLADREAVVVRNAASSLGQLALEPEIVLPALIRTVQHTNREVRIYALRGIARFGKTSGLDAAAVSAVTAALSDRELGVRITATNALRKITAEVSPKDKGQQQ